MVGGLPGESGEHVQNLVVEVLKFGQGLAEILPLLMVELIALV